MKMKYIATFIITLYLINSTSAAVNAQPKQTIEHTALPPIISLLIGDSTPPPTPLSEAQRLGGQWMIFIRGSTPFFDETDYYQFDKDSIYEVGGDFLIPGTGHNFTVLVGPEPTLEERFSRSASCVRGVYSTSLRAWGIFSPAPRTDVGIFFLIPNLSDTATAFTYIYTPSNGVSAAINFPRGSTATKLSDQFIPDTSVSFFAEKSILPNNNSSGLSSHSEHQQIATNITRELLAKHSARINVDCGVELNLIDG